MWYFGATDLIYTAVESHSWVGALAVGIFLSIMINWSWIIFGYARAFLLNTFDTIEEEVLWWAEKGNRKTEQRVAVVASVVFLFIGIVLLVSHGEKGNNTMVGFFSSA